MEGPKRYKRHRFDTSHNNDETTCLNCGQRRRRDRTKDIYAFVYFSFGSWIKTPPPCVRAEKLGRIKPHPLDEVEEILERISANTSENPREDANKCLEILKKL